MMENGKKAAQKMLPGKKEMRKQLVDKMEAALPELREMLGEKKFQHRLKKMAKLLTEGLHKEDVPQKIKTTKTAAGAKKAAAKKAPAAKAAKKAATPKKA